MNNNYDIIIPDKVLHDEDLQANAKLLYGEIVALRDENGCCWASDSYFGNLYEVTSMSVSRWIKALVDKGYITTKKVRKGGSKGTIHRCIKVVDSLD